MRPLTLHHQPPALQLDRRAIDAVAVFHVSGALDLFTAPELRKAFDDAVAEGAVGIVADLGAVAFIDSTGVAALVHGSRRLGGGHFAVVCASQGPVGRLFARVRADEIFDVYERPEDAFVALR